jgi:hypothetical protein
VRRDVRELLTVLATEPVRLIERPASVMRLAVVLLALLSVAGCAVVSPPARPTTVASPTTTPTPAASGCACATADPTGPPGGLSRDEAIAAALRQAPSGAAEPSVIWASIEQDPFAAPVTSGARLVWEVRLQVSFAASPCPSGFLERVPSTADPACLDSDSGLVAVLDIFSGALVGWTH